MASDDHINKFNNNSDELEYNDNVNQDNNDLDFDVLFNALDEMFVDDEQGTNLKPDLQNKPLNKSSKILHLVQKMYKLTEWENVEEHNEVRPKLCSICYTLSCDHVRNSNSKLNIDDLLENAIQNCMHETSDEWVFEEVCAKCIISSCEKVNSSPSTDLFVLWDEIDFIQYFQWIQKLDKETTFTN